MSDSDLITARLVLSPLGESDKLVAASLYSDARVTAGWDMPPYEGGRLDEHLRKLLHTWQEGGYRQFVAREIESGAPVGVTGVRPTEDEATGELSYVLAPEAWGRGYATEAAARVVAWAFAELGLSAVIATTRANAASDHVLAKLGFTHTGSTVYEGRAAEEHVLSKAAWNSRAGAGPW